MNCLCNGKVLMMNQKRHHTLIGISVFLCDIRDKEEFHRVEMAIDEMFDTAISLQGTLSGEHGIGTAKAKWMEKETSRGTILYSQRLRRALDPKGLLNPTKLVGI